MVSYLQSIQAYMKVFKSFSSLHPVCLHRIQNIKMIKKFNFFDVDFHLFKINTKNGMDIISIETLKMKKKNNTKFYIVLCFGQHFYFF